MAVGRSDGWSFQLSSSASCRRHASEGAPRTHRSIAPTLAWTAPRADAPIARASIGEGVDRQRKKFRRRARPLTLLQLSSSALCRGPISPRAATLAGSTWTIEIAAPWVLGTSPRMTPGATLFAAGAARRKRSDRPSAYRRGRESAAQKAPIARAPISEGVNRQRKKNRGYQLVQQQPHTRLFSARVTWNQAAFSSPFSAFSISARVSLMP